MTSRRNSPGISHALMLAAVGLGGCNLQLGGQPNGDGGNGGSQRNLVVFFDPDSTFSTSDVRDVEEQIVRFDADTLEIIWAESDEAFQAGNWATNGNLLASGGFTVRFGTKDGERRAYFTETGPATICDIRVSNGILQIFPTNVTVPQQ